MITVVAARSDRPTGKAIAMAGPGCRAVERFDAAAEILRGSFMTERALTLAVFPTERKPFMTREGSCPGRSACSREHADDARHRRLTTGRGPVRGSAPDCHPSSPDTSHDARRPW